VVDGTLRWVLRHEKRGWIVITVTIVPGWLLVLPAVEEYSAAKERSKSAREKLAETKLQVQNLPQLQRAFDRKKSELGLLAKKAVNETNVEQFRETLHKLIRETGCTLRVGNIGANAMPRAWMTNDSPLGKKAFLDPGPETNFVLINRNAKLEIEGPMASVYQFMARVSQLDRFIHVKHIKLERSSRDENVTQLDMDFDMFDLTRKKAATS
jgi:Tfp pilus assembly protein PilO